MWHAEPFAVAEQPRTSGSAPEEVPVAVLSAHLSAVGEKELDGLDGILLVFSSELDPLTLAPEQFAVRLSDGELAVPERAMFAPADERDENRSVLLVGRFWTEPTEKTESRAMAESVIAGGALFAEDGRRVDGLVAEVSGLDAPLSLSAVEVLAAEPGRCQGWGFALRTYWADRVQGVEPADLEQIRVLGADGGWRHPSAFDDGAPTGHPEDNVVDLCVAGDPVVLHLHIGPGLFSDPSNHPSPLVDVPIPYPPPSTMRAQP